MSLIQYIKQFFKRHPKSSQLNRTGVSNLFRALLFAEFQPRDSYVLAPFENGETRVGDISIRFVSGNIIMSYEYVSETQMNFKRVTISIGQTSVFQRDEHGDYQTGNENSPDIKVIHPIFETFAIYVPLTRYHKQAS